MIESGLATCANGGKMRETKSRVFYLLLIGSIIGHVSLLARAVRLFCFVLLHYYGVFHASNFAFRDKIHRYIH